MEGDTLLAEEHSPLKPEATENRSNSSRARCGITPYGCFLKADLCVRLLVFSLTSHKDLKKAHCHFPHGKWSLLPSVQNIDVEIKRSNSGLERWLRVVVYMFLFQRTGVWLTVLTLDHLDFNYR